MPSAMFGDVLHYLRNVCAVQEARERSDVELLKRFNASRDESAFTVLVQRHGPMVLAVCQRVLGDVHSGADCFQATFLALVRRASSIRVNGSLAPWLYAVARRIALRVKAQAGAQRNRERRLGEMPRNEPLDDRSWQELRAVLDEEIGRLPEKYQAAVVLCYFEGKSHSQVAKELGWPKSSVTNRLARAQELLRQQLIRRGVTLSSGLLATVLCEKTTAAPLGAMLTINTVKAGLSLATGKATAAGAVSARVVALADEAVAGLIGVKAKVVGLVMALGLAIGGVGVAGFCGTQTEAEAENAKRSQVVPAKSQGIEQENKDALSRNDLFGDPLPDGAMARLGTVRFRAAPFSTHLVFSPNGQVLAAQGGYGTAGSLFLLDAVTGRLQHQLPASPFSSPAREFATAFSPDSRLLFAGRIAGGQGSFRLIDVATGRVVRQFEDLDGDPRLSSVAFAPDGRTVAAGGSRTTGKKTSNSLVVLWDAATGKQTRNLEWPGGFVMSIAFAPDSKNLVAGDDKTITLHLWEVASGKKLRRLEGNEKGDVRFVAFAHGGKVVVSTGYDWTVRIWDAETGKMLRRFNGDATNMWTAALSPNGNLLASGGHDGTICLWDISEGKIVRQWQAHRRFIDSLAFSTDGKTIASTADEDCAIRRWDTATGKAIDPPVGHSGRVTLLRFAPDGQALFSGGRDGEIVEWDLKTFQDRGRLFRGPLGPTEKGWGIGAFDVSPDGAIAALAGNRESGKIHPSDRLLVYSSDPMIRLCDTATGKESGTCEVPGKFFTQSLCFSPNGKLLASTAIQDGVRLWELATGKELQHLPATRFFAPEVAFSPDGKVLAYTMQDATNRASSICILEIATGKELRRWNSQLLQTGQDHVGPLVFSPNGKVIAAAGLGGGKARPQSEVLLWSSETGIELGRIKGLGGDSANDKTAIMSLAFSPSGRVLAIGASRESSRGDMNVHACKVQLHEVATAMPIRQIEAPQLSVESLAFSPDGRTLATGGADSTILLWDMTGRAKTGILTPMALTAKELDSLLSDLQGDAVKADKAIWALASAPKQSLPLLKERMVSAPAPADQTAKLIADLDSDTFAVRQRAVQSLVDLGDAAEGVVRKALNGQPPLEVRRRLEQIMEKREKEVIPKLRAIEVIEQFGTADARRLLETMSQQAPNPRVAEAAQGALSRLAKRP